MEIESNRQEDKDKSTVLGIRRAINVQNRNALSHVWQQWGKWYNGY